MFRTVIALAAFLALSLGVHSVQASSRPPRPLKRLAHPSTLSLDILPRHASKHSTRSLDTLLHSDSFRLTLTAFGDTFHLHLKPNDHLIHPAARINYYSNSGEVHRTEPLLRESYRVYHGDTVHADQTEQRVIEDAAGGIVYPPSPTIGWARIMVHDQGDPSMGIPPIYEGAFSANGVIHHVQTRENYLRNKHHLDPVAEVDHLDAHLVIFRDSDIHDDPAHHTPASCAHDSLPYNTDISRNPTLQAGSAFYNQQRPPWYDPHRLDDPFVVDTKVIPGRSLVKRQGDVAGNMTSGNFIDSIGDTTGCPKTQSIVYMGVAADCEYVKHYGSMSNATAMILNNWNTASSLYKTTFNVSMGIVELAVQELDCPPAGNPAMPWNLQCNDAITLNRRLSLFSQWRGSKGANDSAGLWHLMSGCPTGTEVGVAWLGQLCNKGSSGSDPEVVSGTGVSTATRTEWQVVAHEIGHNFGAIHDCDVGCTTSSACCPSSTTQCSSNEGFIMSAVSNAGETYFSPCSIGNICKVLSTTAEISCLQPADINKPTISLQMCGNGIVEPGEDCDPGVGNSSPCCDTSTCKFTTGSVCDPKSSDCCTSACQYANATTLCRPARDDICDKKEFCSGSSGTCPTDQTAANGTPCGGDGLACANGACTSPDKQCKTVGVSLGLQKACPTTDRSCQVSCQDPANANQCIVLQATLVDGSPCGFGGTCQGSVCVSGSIWQTIQAWYKQNLQISIPVTVVVGIVILLMLWGLVNFIRRCCARRKTTKKPSSAGRQRLPSLQYGGAMAATGPAFQASNDQNYPPMRTAPPTSTQGYARPDVNTYPPYFTEESRDNSVDLPNPHQDRYGGAGTRSRGQEASNPFEDGGGGGGAYGAAGAAVVGGYSGGYGYSEPQQPPVQQQATGRSGRRGSSTQLQQQPSYGHTRTPSRQATTRSTGGGAQRTEWVDDREWNGTRS